MKCIGQTDAMTMLLVKHCNRRLNMYKNVTFPMLQCQFRVIDIARVVIGGKGNKNSLEVTVDDSQRP